MQFFLEPPKERRHENWTKKYTQLPIVYSKYWHDTIALYITVIRIYIIIGVSGVR